MNSRIYLVMNSRWQGGLGDAGVRQIHIKLYSRAGTWRTTASKRGGRDPISLATPPWPLRSGYATSPCAATTRAPDVPAVAPPRFPRSGRGSRAPACELKIRGSGGGERALKIPMRASRAPLARMATRLGLSLFSRIAESSESSPNPSRILQVLAESSPNPRRVLRILAESSESSVSSPNPRSLSPPSPRRILAESSELRASSGRAQGELSLGPSLGRAQAELGPSSGRAQAELSLRPSSGRAQARAQGSVSGRAQGRAQAELGPSSGRARAKLGQELSLTPSSVSGRAQGELRPSSGRAQSQAELRAELRPSSGRAQAELSLRPSSGRARARAQSHTELGLRPSSGRARAELRASSVSGRAQG